MADDRKSAATMVPLMGLNTVGIVLVALSSTREGTSRSLIFWVGLAMILVGLGGLLRLIVRSRSR